MTGEELIKELQKLTPQQLKEKVYYAGGSSYNQLVFEITNIKLYSVCEYSGFTGKPIFEVFGIIIET